MKFNSSASYKLIKLVNISPSLTPTVDYIIATKHICDSVGENNLSGKTDHTEYYVKVKDVLYNL